MSPDRPRAEVLPVVAVVVGIVVALVSAVFGVCAHGLAAGSAAIVPARGDLLLILAASAGIGAVTAVLAQRKPPLLTAASGLLAGQATVHLVLATGHAHLAGAGAGAGSTGGGAAASAAHAHRVTDPATVRAAMDLASAGGVSPFADTSALLTPAMLGAHVAAVVLTLTCVGILTATLAWVAARVVPLLERVHLVVVAPLLSSYDTPGRHGRLLLVGGGTRAPPAAV